MCYDTNARPPEAPGAAGAAHGEDIELTAADGNRFVAYSALTGDPEARAQVLILPDVRGLHNFYKELALRFAERGINAVAIDYFGRTAGTTVRGDSFDHTSHVQQLEFPTVIADVRAGLDFLRGTPNASKRVFTLGFCMGGGLSLLAGTQDFDLAGVIGFYAGLSRRFPGSEGTALEEADKIHFPVLGLFGGADQGIPESAVHELDEKLGQAGVDHEIVIYPGAPHSFFDRKATEYAAESTDAWQRVLGFISAVGGGEDGPAVSSEGTSA